VGGGGDGGGGPRVGGANAQLQALLFVKRAVVGIHGIADWFATEGHIF